MENELLYDEVFDAQEHFRIILDSMARPGKINTLHYVTIPDINGINSAGISIALALLNTDASFCTLGDADESIAQYIALHTAGNIVPLQKADFVFVPGMHADDFIGEVKTGTLTYPEDSATLIINVANIGMSPANGSVQLTLKGPGVKDTTTVYIIGLNPDLLATVKEENKEFPLGIDLILTDQWSNIICIPRSNQFTYQTI